MMWQTPALALTAQAFLFSAALSPTSSETARLIATVLSLVASLPSMQLMAKHRYLEKIDHLMLRRFERNFSLESIHDHPKERGASLGVHQSWPDRMSSYRVWMAGLALFAVAAIGIIVVSTVRPSLLNGASGATQKQPATMQGSPCSAQPTQPAAK